MAAKQQRKTDGEGGPAAKRLKETINVAAAELVCPITSSLPIDPVMAEDGHVYEREAIESWFARGRQTSPATNTNIGTKLIPSTQVRNLIEHMVRSGTISGDVADKWTQRIHSLDQIKHHRDMAENGDVASMQFLGRAYKEGEHGLAKDVRLATEWYRKAADKGDVRSYNTLGSLSDSPALKLYWWTLAAAGGAEHACWVLGDSFKNGSRGLPQDRQLAKAWFTKMSQAPLRNAIPIVRDDAAKALRELSGE